MEVAIADSTEGISPTLCANRDGGQGVRGRGIGSNNAPKILVLDDYNGMIHREGQAGSVTTTWGHTALRNGWKIMEVYDSLDNCF